MMTNVREQADEVRDLDDALTDLKRTLISVNEVSKEQGQTWAQNLSESKKWTIASRILSGSGLWKVQNRIRAIVDTFAVYHNHQTKAMKATMKQTEVMVSFAKSKEKLIEMQNQETEATAMYQMLVTKGLTHEQAAFGVERERKALEKLHAREMKRFAGNFLQRRALRKEIDKQMKQEQLLADLEGPQRDKKGRFRKKGTFDAVSLMMKDSPIDKLTSASHVFGKIGEFGDKYKAGLEFLKDKEKVKTKAKEIGVALKGKFAKGMELFKNKIRISILPKLLMALKGFLMGMLYFMLFLTGAFIIFKIIQKAWPHFTSAFEGAKEDFMTYFVELKEYFLGVWASLKDIWNAFTSGTLMDLFAAVFSLVENLLGIGWVMLKTTFKFIGIVVSSLWNGLVTYIQEVGINYFLGKLTQVLFIWGMIMLARWAVVALATKIMAVAAGIPLSLIAAGAVIATIIAAAVAAAFDWNAAGGITTQRMSVVGERGPEIVRLPAGSRVYSNRDSQRMGGGNTNVVNVTVQGRVGASDREVRDMAGKIGRQLSREINRTTSSPTRL